MAIPASAAVAAPPPVSLQEVFQKRPQPVALGAPQNRALLMPHPLAFGDGLASQLPVPGMRQPELQQIVFGHNLGQWALDNSAITDPVDLARGLALDLSTIQSGISAQPANVPLSATVLTDEIEQKIQALTAYLMGNTDMKAVTPLLASLVPISNALIAIQAHFQGTLSDTQAPAYPFGSLGLTRLAASVAYLCALHSKELDRFNPTQAQSLTLLVGAYARQLVNRGAIEPASTDPVQANVLKMRMGHLVDLQMVDEAADNWFAASAEELADIKQWQDIAQLNYWWLNVQIGDMAAARTKALSRLNLLRRLNGFAQAEGRVDATQARDIIHDLALLQDDDVVQTNLPTSIQDKARARIVTYFNAQPQSHALRAQMSNAIRHLIGQNTQLSTDEQKLFRDNAMFLLCSPGKQYADYLVGGDASQPIRVSVSDSGELRVKILKEESERVLPFLQELRRLNKVMGRDLFPVKVGVWRASDTLGAADEMAQMDLEEAIELCSSDFELSSVSDYSESPPVYEIEKERAWQFLVQSGPATLFLRRLWTGPSNESESEGAQTPQTRRASIMARQELRSARSGEDIPVQIMRQRRAASDDVDRLFKSLDLPDSRDFQTQQTVISELDVLEARVYDESTWFHTEMAKLIHVGGNVSPENQLNTFLGILSVITHLGQLRLQQFNLLKRVNGDQNGEFDMAVQHIEKLVAQAGRIYQQLTQGEQTLKDGQHSVAHQLKLEGLMRVLSKYPSLTQYFLNPKPDFGVMRDVDVEILHPFGPNGTSTAISNLSVATSRAETPQPVRRRLEEDFARAGDALPSSSSSSLISSPSQSASPLPPFLASPLVRSEPVLDSVAPSTLTEKLQAISNALEVLSQDSELDFEIQKYKEKICLYKYLQALEDKADMNGFSDIQDPHERVRQVLDSLVPPTSLGGDVAYSTLDLELLQLIYHYVLNESNEHRFVFDAAAGMPDNVRRWALRYDQISQVVLTDKGDSLLDKLLSVIQANGSESTPLMAVERLFLLHQIKSGVLSAAPDEALGKWVNHVLMQQVRHMPTVLHTDELHPVLWTRLQEIVRDTFTIDADADTLLGRTTPVNEFMLMRARATVNDTKNTLQLTEAQIGAYNRWYRDYVMMHELCRNLKDCKDQGALDTFMALSQIKTLRRFAPENCGVMLDLRARLRWLGAQDLGINVADYLQNSDDIADHNWVRDDIEQNGYNPEQFAHNFYFRAPMINQIHAATILPPTQAKITPPWQLELPEIFVF